MQKGIYTIGALDNADNKLSLISAEGSFCGTGISIIQVAESGNEEEIAFFHLK